MYTILRLKKVIEKTGLARSTIYKKIAEKGFPQQISLGGKAVGWLKADVDKWIERQILKSANDNFTNPGSYIVEYSKIQSLWAANDNKSRQHLLPLS